LRWPGDRRREKKSDRPPKVKPVTCYIVVRGTTLKGKKVGKLLKFKFTLK
jgi:hypothetical protein